MLYGHISGIDKPISRFVQGTMMVSSAELEASFKLLDSVYSLGCTTFDTAHIYGGGDNERTVGRWVSERKLRDKVVIIGKGAHHNQDRKRVTPWDISSDIADSLARFQFDYIDLYLLHRDDPTVPVGPIVEALDAHQRAGRIHAFGGSNWSYERIQQANDYAAEHNLAPFVASSPNFSLADQVQAPWKDCVSISGKQGKMARDWYQQNHMPLFTWSSLAGGFFSGRFHRDNLASFDSGLDKLVVSCYCVPENFERLDRVSTLAMEKSASVPQIALDWVMNQPLDIYALVGCRSHEEFAANAQALGISLTATEIAWLDLQTDKR